MAFAIATTVVFGGGAAVFVYTVRKLQMETVSDMSSFNVNYIIHL